MEKRGTKRKTGSSEIQELESVFGRRETRSLKMKQKVSEIQELKLLDGGRDTDVLCRNLPRYHTYQQLEASFSIFGEVMGIWLLHRDDPGVTYTCSCIVRMLHPEQADKIVNKREFFIGDRLANAEKYIGKQQLDTLFEEGKFEIKVSGLKQLEGDEMCKCLESGLSGCEYSNMEFDRVKKADKYVYTGYATIYFREKAVRRKAMKMLSEMDLELKLNV